MRTSTQIETEVSVPTIFTKLAESLESMLNNHEDRKLIFVTLRCITGPGENDYVTREIQGRVNLDKAIDKIEEKFGKIKTLEGYQFMQWDIQKCSDETHYIVDINI